MLTSSLTQSTYKLPKEKRKSWCILIYTEWDNWMEIFSNLKKEPFLFMAWCLHDKDVKEDGTPEKEHLHIRIRYKNQVWNSAICERTGLPYQYKIIERVQKSFRGAVRYLIHYDDPDKYQYDYDMIGASDFDELKTFFDDNEESFSELEKQQFDIMYSALKYENFVSEMDFIKWCYDNGLQKVANKWKYIIHADFPFYQGIKRDERLIYNNTKEI